MNDTDKMQRIYDELVEEAKRIDSRKRDGEFSIGDFISSTGMGKDNVKKFLERQVSDGVLKKRSTNRGNFYSAM